MSEWWDIETAPKDGTEIDLFGTRNGKPHRFPDARWVQECFGGILLDVFSWRHKGWDIYGEFEYTHWMPLPDPPVQE